MLICMAPASGVAVPIARIADVALQPKIAGFRKQIVSYVPIE